MSAIGQRCEFAVNCSDITKHSFIFCGRRNCLLAMLNCGQSSKTLRIPMSVLQEVYSAGGSVTFGRGDTDFMFDVNQTRALIDNYIRQNRSAHFVGAVRRTNLYSCTTVFTCSNFFRRVYSRLKLSDTGTSYNIYIYIYIYIYIGKLSKHTAVKDS